MKALLLNGQSHHGWLASSPLVKKILEQTCLFSVDIKTRPPKGSDMSGFRPEFEAVSYTHLTLPTNREV